MYMRTNKEFVAQGI